MTLTQKRACLTLGALAKNLKDIDNDTEAQRIIEKFETWLGIHNEAEFMKIVKPRERRSLGRKYHDRDNHVALKRSLIHVLGNAGHPRSLQHITSYMELNKANPELRRAATQALRQFTCNESAAHLLRSTLFDSEDIVRHSAYEIYVEHPESKQLTKEQEDAVLAQHYTYQMIARVRRASLADILKALSFHLGMPKYDWSKTVGSRKLGASFGFRQENFVDLHLEPFKGKFELKVDNLAFAEVNVGLIGKKFDIFKVSLCYKKKVEYDLNVLKDFGFDDIQNVATLFDRLYNMIIDPVLEAAKTIKELIEMVTEMTFVQLVKEIIKIFKNLPDIIHKIVESVVAAYYKLIDYDGYPLIDRFKKVISRVTTFINDVKSDVLGFYHSIADAMTVTLPFVAHEMGEGFILIKDSWKFWENPVQSFNGIEMALLKFKLAVATFIEAKNRIMDSCFFAKGQTPYWFHPVVEIKGILTDLKAIYNMTQDEIHDIYHNPTASSSLSPDMITDGFNVNGSKRFIQETIKGVVDDINSTLSGVITLAKPFWEKISHLMDMFKKIKHAYTFLRDAYQKGKYYMQKLFGSKFHRKFPKTPASCGTKCGCGKYPRDNKGRKGVDLAFKPGYQVCIPEITKEEKVDNKRKKKCRSGIKTSLSGMYPRDNKGRKGVDLALKPAYQVCIPEITKERKSVDLALKPAYQDVVNPFHGIVHRISDSEVLVRPSRADLAMYEVVVSGFELDMVIDEGKRGTFIKAGKRIGLSTKSTECDTNFLFVAMRKRPNNTESISGVPPDGYSYIDPAPYLKKRFPRPRHKSTCNGFSYFYIGMNAEDGTMTGDPKEKKEKIKRPTKGSKSKTPFGQRGQGSKSKPSGGQRGKNRQGRSVENQQEHPTWMQTFKEKFHNMTGKFDKFKNILSKVKVKSFLPKFHIDKKPLSELKHLLAGSPLIHQLDVIVKEVADKLRTEPLMYPDGMPLQQIRRKLKKAHTTVTGDRLSMIDKLLEMAVEDCKPFEHAIIAGYGHYCEAHEDCHGITCGMVFRDGFKRTLVKVDVRLDSCSNQLHITIKDQMINFTLTSQKQIMVVDLSKTENTELVFDISIETSNDTINVTLSGAVCSTTHYSCFEDVELLKDLPIDTQSSVCFNKQARDPFVDRVYSLTLPDLLEEVSEFGLDMTKCLVLINEIRNATLYALMELREKGEHVDGEFPEKEDFCFEGSLPLAELDMQIINPGPNKMFGFTPPGIEFQFFVGPVALDLAFGATARMGIDLKLEMCIMSMKAKAVVTPHIGTSVWGSIKVDIGFAYGGIRLEGHLLETSFPITAEFRFGKFPIKLGFRLDLEIVPLELKLQALAKLRLLFVTVTVFDACIWKYKLPTYKINIFNKPYEKRDPNPPRISSAATNPRQRRSSPGGCEVKQLEGRDITDTAFLLEVSAKSDVSDITLSYAIGTHRSGTNVQDWTGMTGNTLTAPVQLHKEHYGIPLYWTVKAKNSQGDSSITECNLQTFDNTLPDGRIDESYPYTSHTNKISGNVVVFDDSELVDTHLEAVGFTKSQGGSGSEVIPWQPLILKSSTERNISKANSPLKFFTIGKEGKLTAEKISSSKTDHVEECAQKCVNFGRKCVAFDYEHHSETCDLHATVEGPNAEIHISGTYKNYERLGVGYSSFIEHNLDLQHGMVYILNAGIINKLGYKGYVSSGGTMVDHTPPEPGPVGRATFDQTKFDGCKAAITQRCIDQTTLPNHRKIIDGPKGSTVFNGHEGGVETLYTLANHFMSANWDGFNDNETGIFGYTWSVGTTVCGTDIATFSDPHAHLSSPKFWTNTGYARNLHLPDGPYYVTVQAINNVVHGGAMLTTVCHSTPITVDTTPPFFSRGVTDDDIVFDEDFNLMAMYFDTFDTGSKIKNIDFGLGLTKHDVDVRGYSTFDFKENQTFIVIDDLNLASGEPVWIRLRSVNNVGLFTTAHSDNPILIDRTQPVAGHVLDGEVMDEDLQFQFDSSKVCVQWNGFYDPESGLSEYRWGVGTEAGRDDIFPFKSKTFSRDVKDSCADIQLQHNQTYYSTVIAKNSALNPKTVQGYSNGVLIDTTAPVKGWIVDGNTGKYHDMNFSSETAEIASMWGGFSDPESGIVSYNLDVYINNKLSQTFHNELKTEFVDYSLSMKHGDHIYVKLTAKNGADISTVIRSDGFIIDQTPPIVKYLYDTEDGKHYQSNGTSLNLKWEFDDPESGMKEYRYYIEDFHQGQGQKFYPIGQEYITLPIAKKNITANVVLSNLNLLSGHKYSVKVVAINHADMPTSQESAGVMIDTTPPVLEKIYLGLETAAPEISDDKRFIEHDDQHSITLTLKSYDFQSSIIKSYVAIGTSYGDTSITNGFLEFGAEPKVILNDLNLKPATGNDSVYYYVQVKVENGAGMFSEIKNLSLPIKVLKDNIPGKVFDGRSDLEDADFTIDRTSVGMSFVGFESVQCSIVGYEWAIGSQPFYYDVLPFTRYGIVLVNDTHGRGQIHTELYEGSTYYITVRAQTGHLCKEKYILSCSNGFSLDTTPPDIRMISFGKEKINPETITTSLYQNRTDSLDFRWESKDAFGVVKNWWSIGSLPGKHDIHPVTVTKDNYIPAGSVSFKHGQTFFLNTGAIDKAGNQRVVSSPSITVDTTLPEILDLRCTGHISVLRSLVDCKWEMIREYESTIKNFTVGVGSEETKTDISLFHKQDTNKRSWTRDLLTRIKKNNLTEIYIIFKLENVLGMAKTLPYKVIVDRSIPIGGKVDIVTSIDLDEPIIKQYCQIPLSFIEFTVNGWQDENSGIERYEAAIGAYGRTKNIQDFSSIDVKDKVLIPYLNMEDGSDVTVTVRAFNKAGLYNQVTSDPVIVSLVPHLTVIDGTSLEDEDYQTSLNVIQGYWKYSDRCKIKSAEWSIEDIEGNILQDYLPLLAANSHFYSDVMNLTNGFTYINIIRTVDALNRTRIARSDGIAVKIEPPVPGTVRDGERDDLTYQESIHELSVNWDSFGDAKSRDPTQKIRKYEVAIGTDRRYAKTRSNVHYFVEVGLNTSYSFKNMNLTAKTVTYYMTVRGYSNAGSYQEESSNGIKVGYHDEIFPGLVEYNTVQSYTDKLYVSWSGFQADMGIDQFRVGVSTFKPIQLPNTTLNCKQYEQYIPDFDVVPLHDVGIDTFTEMKNLTLIHGHQYYVAVIATDSTQRCIGSYGPSVMIDATPPSAGELYLPGGIGPNVAYVFGPQRLKISWTEFMDPESSVHKYEVKLYSGTTCYDAGKLPEDGVSSSYSVMRSTDVTSDLQTEFYDLRLNQAFTYVITITAVNGAGLKTTVRSPPVRLDITPPIPGAVKMGTDWKSDITFQSSTNKMEGMIGIAHTKKASECQRQVQVFPEFHSPVQIEPIGLDFDSECVVHKDETLSLFIRHDDQLQNIIKGGVKLSSQKILEGNYSTILKAAPGNQMVTSWFLASNFDSVFSDFVFSPPDNDSNVEMEGIANSVAVPIMTSTARSKTFTEVNSDSTDFITTDEWEENTTDDGLSDKTGDSENITGLFTTTLNPAITHQIKTTKGHGNIQPNGSNDYGTELFDHYGVGFHIPGYQFNGKWYGFIWIRDKYKTITRQVELKFDPTVTYNNFIVNLEKVMTPITTTWSIQVFLNGETIVQFSGIQFKDIGVSGLYTWNKDNYFPPIENIMDPFVGEAIITSLKIPLPKVESMKCVYGTAFYDGESQIKELWVGISDSTNNTDSIAPMTLYSSFCIQCQSGCNIGCEKSCTEKHTEDFQIIDIVVRNLSLTAATVEKSNYSSTDGNQFNATTYYYNVKTVNFAGQETVVQSKGIMVDTTPPDLQYVRCVDPSNSMEVPTTYQGTNSSMGAYWECSEDVGDIVDYIIQIGSEAGTSDIKPPVSVGFSKKIKVDGLRGKLLHDHIYFLTVTAVNSAGLTSQDSCNVTVEIMPPDVSNVTLSYMYSDDVVDDTIFTAEEHDIGLEWEGGKEDVAFYEWEIGSEPGTDDVFPRIMVGITESKKAFIRDGKLWIDETSLNASVGEFANTTWNNETMKAAKLNTFFNLEPGICVYVTLYAVGRSHLSSTVYSNPLCVKRNGDSDLEFGTPNKRKRESNKLHGEIKLQDTTTKVSADIIIKGRNVTILAGILNQTDVTADYGTAASAKYTRYLIDPLTRWEDTSRFLRHRLNQYAGLMFYLSPSISVESLTEICINVKFDSSLFDTNTEIPVLMYWDNYDQLWKHPTDTCNDVEDKTDFVNKVFTTQACKEVFSKTTGPSTRKKRSVPTNVPLPRMWSLMVMSRRAPNTPPHITTSELFVSEDMDDLQGKNGQRAIQYEDSESDEVEFTILQPPLHGHANITSDGTIVYLPDSNYNGADFIIVKVVETGLLPPFHPLSATRNITINITPINDAPVLMPFESEFIFEETEIPGKGLKSVQILLDGNLTKKYDLGHVTFLDVDFVNPSINGINYTMRMNNTLLSNFSFEPIQFHGMLKKKLKLSLSVDKTFYGRTVFTARGYDQARYTTKNLEVNVYILIAPCVHGNCLNKTLTECDDIERASSFEKYSCKCDRGYTDEWCQTDINECDPNPCSVFYDCEDLIGYQKCNLNVVKTILLTFAVFLTLVMCFMLIRRFYKKKRPNKIDPGSNTWSFGSEDLGQKKGRFIRPTSASSTEDLVPSCTVRDINIDIGKNLIPLCTVRENNVGNHQSSEEKVGSHTENSPKTGNRIVLLSEKTMDSLTKTLEPISTLTATIGLRAPHHKPLRMKTGENHTDTQPNYGFSRYLVDNSRDKSGQLEILVSPKRSSKNKTKNDQAEEISFEKELKSY
ncbi:uncharacterized protein LOC134727466 [Mytilus trossulus]|uniref:uncharacterized protein LOC134727466 n=1 Tax=Mytilus trossulus TaxID=6551 RepID=UPI003005B1AF